MSSEPLRTGGDYDTSPETGEPAVVDWATFEDGEIAVMPARDLVKLILIAERRAAWPLPGDDLVSQVLRREIEESDARLYVAFHERFSYPVGQEGGVSWHSRHGWLNRLASAADIIKTAIHVAEDAEGVYDRYDESQS